MNSKYIFPILGVIIGFGALICFPYTNDSAAIFRKFLSWVGGSLCFCAMLIMIKSDIVHAIEGKK